MCVVDVRTPDRVGPTVSMTVMVTPCKPRVSQQNGDDYGSGYCTVDGSPSSWTDGWMER